jgi:hypothetical protein
MAKSFVRILIAVDRVEIGTNWSIHDCCHMFLAVVLVQLFVITWSLSAVSLMARGDSLNGLVFFPQFPGCGTC